MSETSHTPTSTRSSPQSNSGRAGIPNTSHQAQGQSVIGPTLVVRGEVSAQEDLLIRGRVEGTIDHNQILTIHSEGVVEAVVRAKEIHVEGSVEGDLFGTERIKVCATGRVVGNVVAPRVAVMEGAHFKGMVDMDSDAAAIERRFQEQTGNRKSSADSPKGSETKSKASGRNSGRNGDDKAIAAPDNANALEEKVSADVETPAADDQSSDAKAS